jgi:hypothetical protein
MLSSTELDAGYRSNDRQGSRKRPSVEGYVRREVFRKTGDRNLRERMIDRANDHYTERITDHEGNVLHDVDEALTEHYGHGSGENMRKDGPAE